mmetsp:Transcript_41837/g.91283  ORF Transcript_41837/g.91283 Transcript_41837/m.91283 type:complete len:207 (+) Transcript_41837:71-691(+)
MPQLFWFAGLGWRQESLRGVCAMMALFCKSFQAGLNDKVWGECAALTFPWMVSVCLMRCPLLSIMIAALVWTSLMVVCTTAALGCAVEPWMAVVSLKRALAGMLRPVLRVARLALMLGCIILPAIMGYITLKRKRRKQKKRKIKGQAYSVKYQDHGLLGVLPLQRGSRPRVVSRAAWTGATTSSGTWVTSPPMPALRTSNAAQELS